MASVAPDPTELQALRQKVEQIGRDAKGVQRRARVIAQTAAQVVDQLTVQEDTEQNARNSRHTDA